MELIEFLNKTKEDFNFYENLPFYASNDARIINEIDNLKLVLFDNLNFNCRYNIKAPKNNYIHIEFADLRLSKNCDHNNIRLYSNFSLTNPNMDLSQIFLSRPAPFIRLCSSETQQSENLIIAEFFEESISNSSFSCFNSKNRICFMTSELASDINPYKKKFKRTNFFNNLLIDIKSDDVKKFNFEIKYNFYSVNIPSYKNDIIEKNYKQQIHSEQHFDSITLLDSKTEYENMFTNEKCEFKCYTIDDIDEYNLFNSSFKICIDESLVCDNEVHCVFNGLDEINCPIKLKSKTILMVLCSIFGFSLSLLFIFCIYNRYLANLFKTQNKNLQNQFKPGASIARNIRYSPTNQDEDFIQKI
ncbi:unnamed protein product [Brachionus calyciflorus]|uniref:Uncharacterized protein n=1 Tax=Brachionus calyciflorus TaxID=104777 RepID=A0A814AG17_9BILA|nr:unnamed protein product [Brachionus calyciflorus]